MLKELSVFRHKRSMVMMVKARHQRPRWSTIMMNFDQRSWSTVNVRTDWRQERFISYCCSDWLWTMDLLSTGSSSYDKLYLENYVSPMLSDSWHFKVPCVQQWSYGATPTNTRHSSTVSTQTPQTYAECEGMHAHKGSWSALLPGSDPIRREDSVRH